MAASRPKLVLRSGPQENLRILQSYEAGLGQQRRGPFARFAVHGCWYGIVSPCIVAHYILDFVGIMPLVEPKSIVVLCASFLPRLAYSSFAHFRLWRIASPVAAVLTDLREQGLK